MRLSQQLSCTSVPSDRKMRMTPGNSPLSVLIQTRLVRPLSRMPVSVFASDVAAAVGDRFVGADR